MISRARIESIRLRDAAHTHSELAPCDVAYLLAVVDVLDENLRAATQRAETAEQAWVVANGRLAELTTANDRLAEGTTTDLPPTKPGPHP